MHKLQSSASTPTHYKFLPQVKQVLLTPKGRTIFPLALSACFLLIGLYSFLGSFLHEAAGLDYLQAGIVTMFYGFACLIAGSQVGILGQKFGQKITINLGFGYIFIQSTLATIAFNVAADSKGLPSGLIGLCLFSSGGLGTAFLSIILN